MSPVQADFDIRVFDLRSRSTEVEQFKHWQHLIRFRSVQAYSDYYGLVGAMQHFFTMTVLELGSSRRVVLERDGVVKHMAEVRWRYICKAVCRVSSQETQWITSTCVEWALISMAQLEHSCLPEGQ